MSFFSGFHGGRCAFPFRRTWSGMIRFLAPAVIILILYFTLWKGQTLS